MTACIDSKVKYKNPMMGNCCIVPICSYNALITENTADCYSKSIAAIKARK